MKLFSFFKRRKPAADLAGTGAKSLGPIKVPVDKSAQLNITSTQKAVSRPLPDHLRTALLNSSQHYVSQKKYASGLRELLDYLGQYPGDEYLLQLAAIVVQSGMSYSAAYDAESHNERLTDKLLADSKLDTIFNECSMCTSTWISMHHLYEGAQITTMNAVGGECGSCHKVYCRKCMAHRQFGVEASLSVCPACGGNIGPVSKPTGRRSRQARRLGVPLEFVLFLREGPIVPDSEYISRVFDQLFPEIRENPVASGVRAIPVERWENISEHAVFLLLNANREYLSDRYDLDFTEAVFEDENIYVVRVYPKDSDQSGLRERETEEITESTFANHALINEARDGNGATEKFKRLCHSFADGNYTVAQRIIGNASANEKKVFERSSMPEATRLAVEKFEHGVVALSRAQTLAQDDRIDDALNVITGVEADFPMWAALFSTKGWLQILNGQVEDAETSLTRALDIDPDLPEAHNNMGMLHMFMAQPADAKRCFNAALALRPDYAEARQNLDGVDEFVKKIKQTSNQAGKPGALFWFNWNEISENGHSAYGHYVYSHILSALKMGRRHRSMEMAFFRDGDVFSNGGLQIPVTGMAERACLKRIEKTGLELCYVVAVYGTGNDGFAHIDKTLRDKRIDGYMGMTTCDMALDDFLRLTGQMSLVDAFTLRGNRIHRENYHFHDKAALEKYGFEVE